MGYFIHNRLYPWGSPVELLRFPLLNIIDKFPYALHIIYSKNLKEWKRLDKITAHEWLIKWLGEKGYKILWEQAIDLKFGDYSKDISAAWLQSRIRRVGNSRKNLFREELYYLNGGTHLLIETLRDKIIKSGGNIYLNNPVKKLRNAKKLEIWDGFNNKYQFDFVISTILMAALSKIIYDFSEDYKKKISGIKYLGVVCAIIELTEPFSEYFCLNISDKDIPLAGIIEYTNLNPIDIKDRKNIIYIPLYVENSSALFRKDKDLVFEYIVKYLSKIKPDFNIKYVKNYNVFKTKLAQPVCERNFLKKIPDMNKVVDGFIAADTSFYYPEDRSVSESINLGKKLAKLVK